MLKRNKHINRETETLESIKHVKKGGILYERKEETKAKNPN